MLEASYIVGVGSAALLIVALAIWFDLFPRPAMQPVKGSPAPDTGRTEIASRLLISAVGLSAVGATLSAVDWFAT